MVGVFVIAGALRNSNLAVHSLILAAIGAVLFAGGIALAVWARLHLGRNWGMPTTQRAEPELVTSGPYRFVRHPIYTGLVPETELLDVAGLSVLAVKRYDRQDAPDGDTPVRVHQEDGCQATATPPGLKYEEQGGIAA